MRMNMESITIKFEGMKLMFDVGEYNIIELKNAMKESLKEIYITEPFMYDRSVKLANSILARCI